MRKDSHYYLLLSAVWDGCLFVLHLRLKHLVQVIIRDTETTCTHINGQGKMDFSLTILHLIHLPLLFFLIIIFLVKSRTISVIATYCRNFPAVTAVIPTTKDLFYS